MLGSGLKRDLPPQLRCPMLLSFVFYFAVTICSLWLASEVLPRMAAALPPRPSALPAAALPLYDRLLWLCRHPVHRVCHTLAYLLCSVCWPLLRRRTPARVAADAVALAGLEASGDGTGSAAAADIDIDSFHLEALEHQMPDFTTWLPYGPIYPWAKQIANKMKLAAWRRDHPEVAEVDLKLPLWVVGLPRTGSTIFHKLMSFDENARTVRAWELRHPVPPARRDTWDDDERFVEFNKGVKLAYSMHPAMKSIHHVMADDPDECIWGMVDCAEPLHLWGALDQPETYKWYVERTGGLVEMYRHYRELLQVLCSEAGTPVSSHLVLKSPHHTFHLPSIAQAFAAGGPSVFIWLHRNPSSVVGSCCSMNLHFREYMSWGFESPAVLGRRTLTRLGDCIRKAVADRATLEASGHKFIDIRYDEFIGDAVGTIRSLYKELNLNFTTEFAEAMDQKLAADEIERAAGQGSSHSYSLETFGLCKSDIHEEFGPYIKTYLPSLALP